jgi:uncharacterized protein YdhG (YjbR/CyaY superfamily)
VARVPRRGDTGRLEKPGRPRWRTASFGVMAGQVRFQGEARMKDAKKTATKTGRKTRAETLTAEEREAMKETLKERRRGKQTPEEGEAEVLGKIAEMGQPDRGIAEQIHRIVRHNAPDLVCRTWYGMPAYTRDDKVICFFRSAGKFKARYATLGFNDRAMLDEGNVWPTSFAVTKLTAADEKKIAALVKKAVG